MDRREFVVGLTIATPLFAGCSGEGDGGENNSRRPATDNGSDSKSTSTASTTETKTVHRSTASDTSSEPTLTDIGTQTNPFPTVSSGTNKPTTNTSNLATYDNRRYPYSIEYLPSWSVDESDPAAVAFNPPLEAVQ